MSILLACTNSRHYVMAICLPLFLPIKVRYINRFMYGFFFFEKTHKKLSLTPYFLYVLYIYSFNIKDIKVSRERPLDL